MGQKFLKKAITFFHELSRRLSSIVEYFIWLVFDLSKFKKIKNEKIDKILLVMLDVNKKNIGGDFVTLGVINYFKQIYPKVKISFLCNKSKINSFGDIKGVDFIEYKNRDSLNNIKKNNFIAALFFNFGFTRGARDFLFIPYRVGFSQLSLGSFKKFLKKFYKNFFLTRKIYNKLSEHMVDFRFKMFEALGFKFPEKKLIFEYSKEDEKNANKFLKKNKIGKFIVIHPGGKYVAEYYKLGKWPPHLWNLDRYAKVADYFAEKGYKIIITGTKDEEILANEIRKFSQQKNKIINACGELSIKEVGALLKKTSLLIATDTAIVHLAYQEPINAKIVELMGPSIPEVVGAWPLNSPKHKILVDKGPCCRSMRKLPFKDNYNCLQNITVKQVIEVAKELL